MRATLDPADGGRKALHVAARKCVGRGSGGCLGPVKGLTQLLPCPLHATACALSCLPTELCAYTASAALVTHGTECYGA